MKKLINKLVKSPVALTAATAFPLTINRKVAISAEWNNLLKRFAIINGIANFISIGKIGPFVKSTSCLSNAIVAIIFLPNFYFISLVVRLIAPFFALQILFLVF